MTMQTAARTALLDRCSPRAAYYLVSIDSAKNSYRFYRMQYQRTLWGEDVLVQTWGRQGTNGRTRVRFLEDREHVHTEMAMLLRRRLQHGYEIVTTTASGRRSVRGIAPPETLWLPDRQTWGGVPS